MPTAATLDWRPGERRLIRARVWRHDLWRHRWPLLFVSPFFLLFAVFNLYPIGFSFWLSLHDWSGLGSMVWLGLDNYFELVHDSIFWNSMANSAIIFLGSGERSSSCPTSPRWWPPAIPSD